MAQLAIDGSKLTPTSDARATAIQEKASLVHGPSPPAF